MPCRTEEPACILNASQISLDTKISRRRSIERAAKSPYDKSSSLSNPRIQVKKLVLRLDRQLAWEFVIFSPFNVSLKMS